MRTTETDTAPAFATVKTFCAHTGMGRSTCYALISAGSLRAKKLNRRTLVDMEHGLVFLRSLPDMKPQQPAE